MKTIPFELLEFDKLLGLISDLSNSAASRKSVSGLLPLNNPGDIETRQRQIGEIMKIYQEGAHVGLSPFPDISRLIIKARPEGAVLEAGELSGFMPVLMISSDIAGQINGRDDLPFLKRLTSGLTGFPDIFRILKRSVDSEGNILDGASALLSDLREQARRLDAKIRKKLEEMVRDERLSVFLQDDFITKRSGRWVIPVRMDSKGQVAGVVHDISKSGETAFIEPLTIINTSNELENLIAEQKSEELRILRNISARIRDNADGILAEYEGIVYMDTLNCIAKFAEALNMEIPRINTSGTLDLVQARHPLLLLALRKAGGARQVVPLDVRLGGENTIMVITGSNAGGKTIAIKTIGLLLFMALSGMPVPADSSSSFPLAQGLLVDIGDEQSIEDSLSTFSAHISNISEILKKAGQNTVVLIDELGTGTDPDEGAALSCAVLEELRQGKALVFATTHLSDIKGFVHRTDGMLNASMEFDRKTLTPLYRLRAGEPGQSYALETAKRYGLPDSIIDSAKAMLGGIKIEFDNLISDLNQKRAWYEEAIERLRRQEAELEDNNRVLVQRLSEAETRQRKLLAKAYKDASEIVLEAKRQMHAMLDELKKKDKPMDRKAIKELLQKAGDRQKDIAEKLKDYDADDAGAPSIEELREGDVLFVRSLGYDASVVKVMKKQNRLRVTAGGMEIELPVSDIGFKKGRPLDIDTGKTKNNMPDEMPLSRINLIGSRVDEALSRLEPFLNHAALAGLAEVTVIHGFGTGILSKAVREQLGRHPLVKKFRGGERAEGGNGVTVVTMA